MTKPQLKVRLEEKTLFANGERIRLDNSLSSVELILESKTNYLELIYSPGKYVAKEEAERISHFLEKQKLTKPIKVSPSPDYLNEDSQLVTLVGDFNPTI